MKGSKCKDPEVRLCLRTNERSSDTHILKNKGRDLRDLQGRS